MKGALLSTTLITAMACVWPSPQILAQEQSKKPASQTELAFFESKIRPVLETRCLKCHSSAKAKGGLSLDHRGGLLRGGETGPAVVPGKPDESLLLRALRYDGLKMPPDGRLPEAVVADFAGWIRRGAFDPREKPASAPRPGQDWEKVYQERLKWWSLQPVSKPDRPTVRDVNWPKTDVDCFILNRLEAKKLAPAGPADRRTLARRLSFALTGLPPNPATVERFVADTKPDAFDRLVDEYLASPQFGERWARHWMDVVHYADTHGYEWDVPAKHAWRYRDYLIRAFNADVPFDRLVLEQIAGDLVEPRIDNANPKRERGFVNEALIGPMALRLGERRHGDNADSDGITHEAISNVIDTVSKGFLGTTAACAQCHDHKLDAVGQSDYYALAGVFMSTRWGVRSIDAADPNEAVIKDLRRIKTDIRAEQAKRWASSKLQMIAKIEATRTDGKDAAFPETLPAFLQRLRQSSLTAESFAAERERRLAANRANLTVLADFTLPGSPSPSVHTNPQRQRGQNPSLALRVGVEGAAGWRWDGFGMKHGLVGEGDFVVSEDGPAALKQILPAGRWSHAWSTRLAGALRSPLFDENVQFSVGFAGGAQVAKSFIIDQAFHSERMQFLNRPNLGWLTLNAGSFTTLEGGVDKAKRRVYLELVTRALNNYYPPRTGYGGVKESDLAVDRSWFGVTKIYRHATGKAPLDELARFAPLFTDKSEPSARLANLILAAVERWSKDACIAEDALLLDEALRLGWLPNELQGKLAELVTGYRQAEKKLQPDQTIGSVADWNEARNERIGIRGSYVDLGEEVPRGSLRFLTDPERKQPQNARAAGRLELAQSIASPHNPLTARVYVNRVWLHLFGEGLVRTPDDFGHLGEQPVHPELLDHLARRFMDEGWSTKKLVRMLVTSAVWQQSSIPSKQATQVDPENRLWHHLPMRRLEAEAIRDSLLRVSGRIDMTMYGPPIDPYRTAEDRDKRLLKGPLDGNGRRSIYIKMTLMEPPRFLALFNQPIPRLTVGKRDVTNVPDQALALLNDPFVIAMARHWSEAVLKDGSSSAEERARRMFTAALGRPPETEERARLTALLNRLTELHGSPRANVLGQQPVWQDFAQALFNLKEFIHVQ